MDSPLLTSKSRLFEQQMSRIHPEGTNSKKTEDTIEALLTEYSEVSQVIGYFWVKNTKDSEDRRQARDGSCSNSYGSETTTGVVPLTKTTHRRMAWQGVKQEIFEKVPDGEFITWNSSLVVQPKSKYTDVKKEETQMIRASSDIGIPNKSMRLTTKSGGCHLQSWI